MFLADFKTNTNVFRLIREKEKKINQKRVGVFFNKDVKMVTFISTYSIYTAPNNQKEDRETAKKLK